MKHRKRIIQLSKLEKQLDNLWDIHCLDIRKTKNGRWFDQKVTPDVLLAICGVLEEESYACHRDFTRIEIQHSPAFVAIMTDLFRKPHPKHRDAQNEYDKVVSQPLNVLAASGLLKIDRMTKPYQFSIASEQSRKIIKEMSMSEQYACHFLCAYITQTVRQSEIEHLFKDFFERQDTRSFATLKERYAKFMIRYTGMNTPKECNRIFSKILNILAFTKKKKGTIGGLMSSRTIVLSDIRYNRINLRDKASKKPKDIPRQRWKKTVPDNLSRPSRPQSYDSVIRKTVRDIKEFHNHQPEILDSQSGQNLPGHITVEGHHIFLKSQYPELANLRENIILLTPTQHSSGAHGGNSYEVNPSYQLFCLLQKLDTIIKCEEDLNCNFYSFQAFKEMLVFVGILDKEQIADYKFDDVRRVLLDSYVDSPKKI